MTHWSRMIQLCSTSVYTWGDFRKFREMYIMKKYTDFKIFLQQNKHLLWIPYSVSFLKYPHAKHPLFSLRAAQEQPAGHSDPPCPSTRRWFCGQCPGQAEREMGAGRVRAGNNGGSPNSWEKGNGMFWSPPDLIYISASGFQNDPTPKCLKTNWFPCSSLNMLID